MESSHDEQELSLAMHLQMHCKGNHNVRKNIDRWCILSVKKSVKCQFVNSCRCNSFKLSSFCRKITSYCYNLSLPIMIAIIETLICVISLSWKCYYNLKGLRLTFGFNISGRWEWPPWKNKLWMTWIFKPRCVSWKTLIFRKKSQGMTIWGRKTVDFALKNLDFFWVKRQFTETKSTVYSS